MFFLFSTSQCVFPNAPLCLGLQGKIKSLETIYLYSMPVKEYQIVEYFLGSALKDEVMKIMPVQKQTRAGQRTRFKVCNNSFSRIEGQPMGLVHGGMGWAVQAPEPDRLVLSLFLGLRRCGRLQRPRRPGREVRQGGERLRPAEWLPAHSDGLPCLCELSELFQERQHARGSGEVAAGAQRATGMLDAGCRHHLRSKEQCSMA